MFDNLSLCHWISYCDSFSCSPKALQSSDAKNSFLRSFLAGAAGAAAAAKMKVVIKILIEDLLLFHALALLAIPLFSLQQARTEFSEQQIPAEINIIKEGAVRS
jgi:hypothetical protein